MRIAACLVAGGLAVSVAWARPVPKGIVFSSPNVVLPAGDLTFPGGKEAEAINGNCLSCHSAEMVLNQPVLTKAAWSAEVAKMIGVYKAPVAAGDVPAIVGYLVATRGAK